MGRREGGTLRSAAAVAVLVGAAAGVAALALLAPVHTRSSALLQTDFPMKADAKSVSGKPCWSCPCCEGCRKSSEGRAAGCERFQNVESLVRDAWSRTSPLRSSRSAGRRRFQGLERLPDTMPLFDQNKTMEEQKDAYKVVPGWKHIGAEPHRASFDNVIGDQFDEFRKLQRDDGKFTVHKDPAGVMVEQPAKIVPWMYAEGRHWDGDAPEEPEYSEDGTTYDNSEGTILKKGKMSHGKHKTWKEIPDRQWGWEHQFANWDPDSNANKELVFGAGGLHQSGFESEDDTRKSKDTWADDEIPWEFSFMDPHMKGDDFVNKNEMQGQLDPKFKKPVNNQFWDWQEDGEKNQKLVFGDNKENGGMLRQRTKQAVKDNWNFASDSKVDADDVKDLLAHRNVGVVLPRSGEPVSDLVDGAWAFGNGVDGAEHIVGELGNGGDAAEEDEAESVGGDKQVPAGEGKGGYFTD